MNSYGPGESDSGQGSSLDQRDYGIYNNEPRYANPPGPYSMDGLNGNQRPNGGHYKQNGTTPNGTHHQNGLDLTNNWEYRGSAFELYKKPLSFYNQQSGASVVNSPPNQTPNSRFHHNTNSVW